MEDEDAGFHMPHDALAEMSFLMLAGLIALYRIFGGKNEWLRTHGTVDS